MHCEVCSAPLSTLDSTGHYRCSYCDTLAHVDAESVDRIVLTTVASGRHCPKCWTPLFDGSIEKTPVEVCASCYGFTMEHDDFGQVVASRRSSYQGADVMPGPLDQAKLRRELQCPQCETTMEAHAYCGPGNAVLTTCRDCQRIWLDAGDLTTIERAPGVRQVAETPSPLDDEERPLSLAAQVSRQQANGSRGRLFSTRTRTPLGWRLLTSLARALFK